MANTPRELVLEIQERRKKLVAEVPGLVTRVIALQGKFYSGCGFHWSMMKSAGGLMNRVFNYDEAYDFENLLIDEVIFEGLVESVEKAEGDVVRRVPSDPPPAEKTLVSNVVPKAAQG